MDGVSLSYTCVASAVSGGLHMHSGTRIAVLVSLLKLITVLGSSAYRRRLPEGKGRAGSVPGP